METTQTDRIRIVAAIFEYKNKYLLMRRAPHKENAGMWEFPGGKICENETPEIALKREIKEELAQDIEVLELLGTFEEKSKDKIIQLIGLKGELNSFPRNSTDHDDMRWFSYNEIFKLPTTSLERGLLHDIAPQLCRTQEVVHLDPWSLSKFYGTLYSAVGAVVSLFMIFAPAMMVESMSGIHRMGIAMALFLPIINFIVGGIMGFILAVVYNFISLYIGGVKVTLK